MSINLISYKSLSFVDVIDHGTYFYPAWKHYGRKVDVICDRCAEKNLTACIGFGERDLCLPCVAFLTSNLTVQNDCCCYKCHQNI